MKKVFAFIIIVSSCMVVAGQNAGNDSNTTGLSLNFSNTIAQSDTINKSSATKTAQRPTKKELAKIKAGNLKRAAKTQFRYFIIKAEGNTYGYSIYADENLYIQQNTIPAVAGTRGFSDTASAAKTARLVIKKIKQGEMPPAITINDLKKIGVQ
jgi:Domain of unknown function (DUF4907)